MISRNSVDFNCFGEKIGAENEVVILLNSLPDVYKEVKIALKYGRESISTDAITSTVRTKELELIIEKKETTNSEGLFARGKQKHKWKG